jgi:protein-tyrosine phosphatase
MWKFIIELDKSDKNIDKIYEWCLNTIKDIANKTDNDCYCYNWLDDNDPVDSLVYLTITKIIDKIEQEHDQY